MNWITRKRTVTNDLLRCTAEIHHALMRAFTQLGVESCWFATGGPKFHLIPLITNCDYWPLNLVDDTHHKKASGFIG